MNLIAKSQFKRKLVLLFILSISNHLAFSQTYSMERFDKIGGLFDDEANAIALDDSGNVYITGMYSDKVDFDPSINAGDTSFKYSFSGGDYFVQKLDKYGNLVWVAADESNLPFPELSFSRGRAIDVDIQGNIYVAGTFQGKVDFDPNSGVDDTTFIESIGSEDVFIQKLDPNGNLLWIKAFQASSKFESLIVLSIAIDDSGNIYTVGGFRGNIDFDPGHGIGSTHYVQSSNGSQSVFIHKLSGNGDFDWVKVLDNGEHGIGTSIAIDSSSNPILCGFFRGTLDFDPSLTSSDTLFIESRGKNDAFIQKLDHQGNYLWAKSLGGKEEDGAVSIQIDKNQNLYVAGNIQDTVYFKLNQNSSDTSWIAHPLSSTATGFFVLSLDPMGDFKWKKSFNGAGNGYLTNMTLDSYGSVYSTGQFWGDADFDPGPGIHNLTSQKLDAFVQKLDSLGDFVDAFGFGGVEQDRGFGIVADTAGNIYTTGFFQESVFLNPGNTPIGLVSNGKKDIFIQKLIITPSGMQLENKVAAGVSTYPNPSTGVVFVESENSPISEILIYSMNGVLLKSYVNIDDLHFKFELKEPSGLYIVEVRLSSEIFRYKLVRE